MLFKLVPLRMSVGKQLRFRIEERLHQRNQSEGANQKKDVIGAGMDRHQIKKTHYSKLFYSPNNEPGHTDRTVYEEHWRARKHAQRERNL